MHRKKKGALKYVSVILNSSCLQVFFLKKNISSHAFCVKKGRRYISSMPPKKQQLATKCGGGGVELPWIKRVPLWQSFGTIAAIAVLFIAVGIRFNEIAKEGEARVKAPRSTGNLPPYRSGDDINPHAKYRFLSNETIREPQHADFEAIGVPCPAKSKQDEEYGGDRFTACIPLNRRCRRMVVDQFIEDHDAQEIVHAMNAIIREVGGGGGSGPVSLVELHQGVISKQDKFLSLHHAIAGARHGSKVLPFTATDADRYLAVVKKIHRLTSELLFCETYPCASGGEAIAARAKGLHTLFVAPPSFFSRIGTKPAVTMNDEYWHEHEDRIQYGSFAITTLLYLNTAHSNELDTFEGGSFEFGGAVPASIHPRRGRLSLFTSGAENPHWVAPVWEGNRYALTTAFTCDPEAGSSLAHDGEGSFLYNLLKVLS